MNGWVALAGAAGASGARAIATAAMLGLALVTGGYHLPANAALATGEIPPEAVSATLRTWLPLHALRFALGLAASGFALDAAWLEQAIHGERCAFLLLSRMQTSEQLSRKVA